MYYIDHLTGKGFTGDIIGFQAAETIGNIRFTTFNNIRAREWHFAIQQKQTTKIFLYDFDSYVREYLPDGQTFNQVKETKAEKKACRVYEKKLLKDAGYTYEEIEYLKAKNRFKYFREDSTLMKKARAYFRVIRLWIRYLLSKLFS